MAKDRVLALGAVMAGAWIMATGPATAGSEWSERVDLCMAAISAEQLADTDTHKVKFVSGSGGRTKTVTLKLMPEDDSEPKVFECKVRRDKVLSVELTA